MIFSKKKIVIEPWQVSNEYLNAITEEQAEFILLHSEKALQDSLETNKIITDKATGLLGLAIGIFAALVGYSVGRWSDKGHFDSLLTAAVIGSFYLLAVSMAFGLNVYPTDYYVSGSRPEIFFVKNFFNPRIKCEDRKLLFYINEIEDYYIRILYNRERNNQRWYLFRFAYRALIISPVIFVIAYLIF